MFVLFSLPKMHSFDESNILEQNKLCRVGVMNDFRLGLCSLSFHRNK